MDGNPVKGPSTEHTLTEIFVRLCPEFMNMGMTYDEYWNRNTTVHRAYREAYKLRLKHEEWSRWRQGMYDFAALLCAAPMMRAFGKKDQRPGEYPSEPLPIFQEEVKAREEAERKRRFEQFRAQLIQESKNAGKEESEDGPECEQT